MEKKQRIRKVIAMLIAFVFLAINTNAIYAKEIEPYYDSELFSVEVLTEDNAREIYMEYFGNLRYITGDTAIWQINYKGSICSYVFVSFEFEYSDGQYVEVYSVDEPHTELVQSVDEDISDLSIRPSGGYTSGFSFEYSVKSPWSWVWTTFTFDVTCDTYGDITLTSY